MKKYMKCWEKEVSNPKKISQNEKKKKKKGESGGGQLLSLNWLEY